MGITHHFFRHAQLMAFLQYLNSIGCAVDLSQEIDRVRLQKYVFFAGFFGWDHGYEYDVYYRGPHSTELARDIKRLRA